MDPEETQALCTFCKTKPRQYTCPRCHASYCTVTCYQSPDHLECSETFYQKCVLENISEDSETRQRTLEAIARVHAEGESNLSDLDSDDSSSDCASLSERLADIDLDDTAQVWEKLTHDERQQFKAFLSSGDISNFVPKWEPWWMQENQKIQEVDELTYKKNCPEVVDDIKEFTSLTKKPPAACVEYNLMNVLCSYAFTARYFNGCHMEFLEEAVHCLVMISLSLKDNKNFDSFESAVDSVHQECLQVEWIVVDNENINLMREDTEAILRGPFLSEKKFYILSALSDIQQLIHEYTEKAKTGTCQSFVKNTGTLLQKNKLKLCLKKIEYFLSYTLHCYKE